MAGAWRDARRAVNALQVRIGDVSRETGVSTSPLDDLLRELTQDPLAASWTTRAVGAWFRGDQGLLDGGVEDLVPSSRANHRVHPQPP